MVNLFSNRLDFKGSFFRSSSFSDWVASDYPQPLQNRSFCFIPSVEPRQHKLR
jgi:hypothetical protein